MSRVKQYCAPNHQFSCFAVAETPSCKIIFNINGIKGFALALFTFGALVFRFAFVRLTIGGLGALKFAVSDLTTMKALARKCNTVAICAFATAFATAFGAFARTFNDVEDLFGDCGNVSPLRC